MAKGDILLLTFPFTDLSGSKLRPAVVLAETIYDITVSFITTQVQWYEASDVMLFPNLTNNLKKQSLIKVNKIATIDKNLVKGLLGRLTLSEQSELDNKLKILFQLK